MNKHIDINCDMGESYGKFLVGNDEAIMPFISSCNIACGFHGGDPSTILHTLDLATEHKLKVGAHPSYPDLMGFGRRSMQMDMGELKDCLIYQIGVLYQLAEKTGNPLHHVKVHGALYNDAAGDELIAATILDAVASIDPQLTVFTLPDSTFYRLGISRGFTMWGEAFADRNYNDDLTLVARKHPNAVIHDPELAAQQVWQLVIEQSIVTLNGKQKSLKPDTICIHGDTPGAVSIAKTIYNKLMHDGIQVA